MWRLYCALIMCTFRVIKSLKVHKEFMNILYIECTSIGAVCIADGTQCGMRRELYILVDVRCDNLERKGPYHGV
jgi:hypothetical protein